MSLVVSNLTKKYGDKTVLNGLSFTMDKPGVYALLGTNGAGKTTSIRIILGMLEKNAGEVSFNGKPITVDTVNIGYLAEERGLYPKATLMDQLLYFANLKKVPKKEAEKRIRSWAERLKLMEYLYPEEFDSDGNPIVNDGAKKSKKTKKVKPYRAEQLSKGNQQKVQLMAALISDPELIVLDEPLSGLDPVNTNLFRDVIREEAAKDKYIIMSSHQMATIEEFCTDLTILKHGEVKVQGNLNEIKKSYGRVNLNIKCDEDITSYIEKHNLNVIEVTPNETRIKLRNEEEAHALLNDLIAAHIPVVKFELCEPSLHEIFVEKVEGVHEEE